MGAKLLMAWWWSWNFLEKLSEGSTSAYDDYVDARFARLEGAVFPHAGNTDGRVTDRAIPPAE
jgi:hypothetical protein